MAARMDPDGRIMYRVKVTRYLSDDVNRPIVYGCLGPFNTLSAARARITVNKRKDKRQVDYRYRTAPFIVHSDYEIEYLEPDWKPLSATA